VTQGLLAEISVDMRQSPSAKHLASWVGICSGNHESAGKRLSGNGFSREHMSPEQADAFDEEARKFLLGAHSDGVMAMQVV
jgi:hypothetical protein